MSESEKYKLSTYKTTKIIHQNENVTVELVNNTIDGRMYVKKIYPSDKRAIFDKLKQIQNPHIPQIFEIFFDSNTIIIEQYIEGITLEQFLCENKIIPKKLVNMIMNGILDALEILHKNDIIHRDVKPENIIIKNNGDAVLIDYGIARVISENGGNDTEHLGTVGYAAPEQFGFAPSDYKTDIYAFGITMKRVTANSGASFLIGNIIKKCTEFDPSRRYQSVQNIQARFNFYIRILPTLIFTILFALTIFMAAFIFYKKTGDSEIARNVSDNIQNIIEYSPLTYIQSDNIQYMQFIDNGNYEDNIVLGDNMPETHISVKKCDENITVIVDDKYTFKFIPDKAKPTDLYKNGKLYGEIVFYDFNEDGILEIIPVLSNAIISNVYSDFDMFFLKNYVKGWCIYLNSKNEFVLAEGEMCAAYETLYFYENMPGCIYTDDLCYYTFDKGYIIYNE